MIVNDPIADMLTRIRNAQIARHDATVMPASNTKKAIAKILLEEGYIKAYDVIDDGLQGQIKVTLKYVNGKSTPVIAGLKRISKPGLRVYARCEELPKVLGGHHQHLQGSDDRSRRPSGKPWRRSALLHLVTESRLGGKTNVSNR